jgi:DNA repair exonuclease SbcCD ATPase subunit
MDERKKTIGELEKKIQEEGNSLEALLERFGETLIVRAGDDSSPSRGEIPGLENLEEYRRLQREIADSEDSIKTIGETILRIKNLEEEIESREHQDAAQAKELAALYGRMGKLLLEDPAYGDFSAPWREEADTLVPKIQSLENRIAELDQKEGNNVFTWIGKSAQGVVLRSFLLKAEENLERVYRLAGEQFCRPDNPSAPATGALGELTRQIEELQGQSRARSEELSELRSERRKIGDSFGPGGSPEKQIQNLKKGINSYRDEIKALYRHSGAEAAGGNSAESGNDGEYQEILEGIKNLKESIRNNEGEIEKLKASLAIDEEKARIEKLRNSIEDQKKKIVQAEQEITDFENRIADAEKYIAELEKLL